MEVELAQRNSHMVNKLCYYEGYLTTENSKTRHRSAMRLNVVGDDVGLS